MDRGTANPLGLGLVLIGSVVMAVAAFLPLDDVAGQGQVRENSLIQHGGWMLILTAVLIAAGTFRALQRKGYYWLLPFGFCLYAVYRIFDWGIDKDLRTLYPVKQDGSLDTSTSGTLVPLGIAVYVAGAGVALALFGLLVLRQIGSDSATDAAPQNQSNAPLPNQTKKCPDCAETVLRDAKVCKHCNYRFAAKNIRCANCQHVWPVLVDLTKFKCENCGTTLERKAGATDG
jgi:predicted RNA-binding Zn-ribbon protein involved in translation (DUF1610 family)